MFKPKRLIWKKPAAPECVGGFETCSPTKKALDQQKREIVPQATRADLEKFKSANCYGSKYPFPDVFRDKETDVEQQTMRPHLLRSKNKEGLIIEDIVFNDAGTYFYKVKPGDTLDKLKSRLEQYPELAHLKNIKDSNGLVSFNIRPPEKLPVGKLIPIPSIKEKKEIPPQLFFNYCYDAVIEMAAHQLYGRRVQYLIEKVGIKTLLAAFYAVACAESGDVNKLGTTAFHRYEGDKGMFSYSMFHVLMNGTGEKALAELKLTPGQTYHVKNAVKLCLAFLCEKYNPFFVQKYGDINLSFDNPDNVNSFIRNYTGGPSIKYSERLTQSYAAAQDLLKTAKGNYIASLSVPRFPELPEEKVRMISLEESNGNLRKAARNASRINAETIEAQTLLGSKGEAAAINIITGYINKLSEKRPLLSDKVGIGVDRYSVFVLFKRDNDEQRFFRLSLPDVVAIEQSEQFLKRCKMPLRKKEDKRVEEKPKETGRTANGDFEKSSQTKLEPGDKNLYINPPYSARKIQKQKEDKRIKELKLPKATEANVEKFSKTGKLQKIEDNTPHYYLEQIGESGGVKYLKAESLKRLYPHTKKLLEFLAEKFFKKFKKKLKIVSLLRTEEWLQVLLQRRTRNVSKTSTHAYGCTFDISHGGMTSTEKNFLAELLAKLEKGGCISGTQEKGMPCFHIMDRFPLG